MALFPKYEGPPLIEQVCGVENLTTAWRRVRRNIHVARRGRSAGMDAVTLRDFEADWSRQMAQLADELLSGTYRPIEPKRVAIPKASGGARAIAILAVRDRVAQRAVQQVLEPLFDPFFLDCSYGCRPLVGVPQAVARVARYADQGMAWAVDADIASYFDCIDHRILLGLLRQRVDEPAMLRLVALWLQAGALTTAETAPVAQPPASLLGRGSAAVRQALAWAEHAQPPAVPGDPYAAAQWEMPGMGMPPDPAWSPRQPGIEQHVWTAVMMAKPALTGARAALPLVRRIGGQRLAIAGAVAAGAVAAGEIIARRVADQQQRGAPQGGALSPLLANVYLHPFDLALTSQGFRLVRFVDDFVIMCASEADAERALACAGRQLAVLRLDLNGEKTRIVRYADGLSFLGQALAPRQRGQRLGDGLTNFAEAEAALKQAAGSVRKRLKR